MVRDKDKLKAEAAAQNTRLQSLLETDWKGIRLFPTDKDYGYLLEELQKRPEIEKLLSGIRSANTGVPWRVDKSQLPMRSLRQYYSDQIDLLDMTIAELPRVETNIGKLHHHCNERIIFDHILKQLDIMQGFIASYTGTYYEGRG